MASRALGLGSVLARLQRKRKHDASAAASTDDDDASASDADEAADAAEAERETNNSTAREPTPPTSAESTVTLDAAVLVGITASGKVRRVRSGVQQHTALISPTLRCAIGSN